MSHDNVEAPRQHTVMDVAGEQLARVYAQAFLAAATNANQAAELVEELSALGSEVLDRFPRLESTLASALLTPEEKEQILENVFGGRVTPLLLNFLKVLSAHGRLGILRTVARLAQHLFIRQSGKVEVELHVAKPIDEALMAEVVGTLRGTLGAEPVISLYIDPALIAGFVVRVGDTVYDGSVRTRFERARKAMMERAVEKIESHPETLFHGDS